MAAGERPSYGSTASVSCPGQAGGRSTVDTVRSKRGAGADCGTPSTVAIRARGRPAAGAAAPRPSPAPAPRRRRCRRTPPPTRPGSGSRTAPPSAASPPATSAGSCRTAVGQLRHTVHSGQSQQLGVELRLQRADRDLPPVGAACTPRRTGRRCRAGCARPAPATARSCGRRARSCDSAAVPSTMDASTTWPVPVRAADSSALTTPKASIIAAAAHVAEQVHRRHRPVAGPAAVVQRPGDRDVADVVAGRPSRVDRPGPSRSSGRRPAPG